MKAIWDAIHQSGYATLDEFEELGSEAKRNDLAITADRLGLQFTYDRFTKTATLTRVPDTPAYGVQETVSILNAWLFLVYRAKVASTGEQPTKWMSLTPQSQSRDALEVASELTLTPGRLQSAFPNLYPTPRDAVRALNRLERLSLISGSGDGVERVFKARPLLHHIVNEDQAVKLVGDVLRHEYQHLIPEDENEAALDAQILAVIRNLPPRSANLEAIAERVGETKRVATEHLNRLRQANIIRYEQGGAYGGHYAIVDEEPEAGTE